MKDEAREVQAEALLARLRPQFYGESMSELDMLLRARERIGTPAAHIVCALAIFWFSIEGLGTPWKRWAAGLLALATACDIWRIRLQRREFDSAISIFIKAAPQSLADAIRQEK